MDTKQAITEKQGLVDEMELQLMSSAPESIPCVVELRDELNGLYDEVIIHFFGILILILNLYYLTVFRFRKYLTRKWTCRI
jgi:hypothetical protein